MSELLTPDIMENGLLFVIVLGAMAGLAWLGRRAFGVNGIITKHVSVMTDVTKRAIEQGTEMQTRSLGLQEEIARAFKSGSDKIENTNETVEQIKRAGVAYCDLLKEVCSKTGNESVLPSIDRIIRELNGGN